MSSLIGLLNCKSSNESNQSNFSRMRIICNSEEREIPENQVLSDYLKSLGLDPFSVVVEYNGRIIDRIDYDNLELSEGARLEVIHFVPGG